MKKQFLFILLLSISFHCLGAFVVDQSQDDYTYGFAYDNDDPQAIDPIILWQTFSPTMNTLKQLDLFLNTWERSDGAGGTEKPYGDTVRAAVSIEDSGGTSIWNNEFDYDGSNGYWFDWVSFAVPSVSLTVGETYKIVVVGHGVWRGSLASTYPGTTVHQDEWPNYDFAFKTYSVPEPGTLLIVAVGGVLIRRKQ